MFITKVEKLLVYTLISLIIFVFFVKKQTYELKKDIVDIDAKINIITQNSYTLDIELAYLTSPERLNYLHNKLAEKINHSVIKISQVKEVEKIIPYYYAKTKLINSENPVALRYENN